MSSNFWKSISIRTGFNILLGASLLTVALSWYFYNRTFSEQLAASDHQIKQLVATVESSAAVAAYLDNQELALEVVRGLTSNDSVARAELRSATGMQVESGAPAAPETQRRFALASPFIAEESIGEILIQPNQAAIEQRARQAANVHVLTMAAHSLALVVLVIVLVHLQLTRHLRSLAETLHEIEPGSERRLPCPKRHEHDEVGLLIRDTNTLLAATQNTLEGERRLRIYAESLEKRFRLIFEKASCGIALMNPQGKLMLYNPSFAQIMRIEPDSIANVTFPDLFADAADVRSLLQRATHSRNPINSDLNLSTNASSDNSCLHVLFSSVSDEQDNLLVECILYDISERAQREQQTLFEAERDTLTQLFNRRAGERRIQEALKRARADSTQCAVMLIDLDRFKPINDTYGHDAGDKVLVAVADRLRHSLRKSDIIIRWGGDEFLILILEGNDTLAASVVAEKILEGLRQDIDLGAGRRDSIGASIGIALYPDHGQQSQELITHADQAMYQVKQSGRNGFAYYNSETDSRNPVEGAH